MVVTKLPVVVETPVTNVPVAELTLVTTVAVELGPPVVPVPVEEGILVTTVIGPQLPVLSGVLLPVLFQVVNAVVGEPPLEEAA